MVKDVCLAGSNVDDLGFCLIVVLVQCLQLSLHMRDLLMLLSHIQCWTHAAPVRATCPAMPWACARCSSPVMGNRCSQSRHNVSRFSCAATVDKATMATRGRECLRVIALLHGCREAFRLWAGRRFRQRDGSGAIAAAAGLCL